MNEAQRHRGPDEGGIYSDPSGRIVLGARRLAVIDLQTGSQPLSNEDGSITAVLNGEIYNYRSLRESLLARGHTFLTQTDTEVLVHLYEEFGADLVHSLDGMFAFAIWDRRAGRLVLGRDRLGEKPLFLHHDETGLTFASELGALLAGSPSCSRKLDPESVDAFFIFGYVPGPATIVRGLRQLSPGHVGIWNADENRIEEQRYWVPVRFLGDRTDDAIGELKAETLRLLEQSVARSLVADVPVGVFLSGGVDSSLLAALIARQRGPKVPTFTVTYDIGNVSEGEVAHRTSLILDTDHHELLLRSADVASRVAQLLGTIDQPLADPALVPLHAVAELAREHVTVAIGGEGADELFGGYPRYRWLAYSAAIREIVPRGGRIAAYRLLRLLPLGERELRFGKLVTSDRTLERQVDWVTSGRRAWRQLVYGPRLRDCVDNDVAIARVRQLLPDARAGLGPDAFAHVDLRHWLPDDVLAKADRAGMLNSLEVRSPYLARELVEFANSIDMHTHLKGSGKLLVRRTLADIAPELDTRRRKLAFQVPGMEWLRGPLRPTIDRIAESSALVADGYLDRDGVATLAREHAAGVDHTTRLWPILALHHWYENFAGAA